MTRAMVAADRTVRANASAGGVRPAPNAALMTRATAAADDAASRAASAGSVVTRPTRMPASAQAAAVRS
jgi:hypothetical protein